LVVFTKYSAPHFEDFLQLFELNYLSYFFLKEEESCNEYLKRRFNMQHNFFEV